VGSRELLLSIQFYTARCHGLAAEAVTAGRAWCGRFWPRRRNHKR